MFKVGIIGDGYTAADLMRLLAGHDGMEAVAILSTENIGRRVDQIYPHLTGFSSLVCQESDPAVLKGRCDAVFLALPHGLSVAMASQLLPLGIKCVDLGADFRLKDPALYRQYYELEHSAPKMLEEAVYGLPELYRRQIRATRIVANPGCYPTSAILPLAPLLQAGLVEGKGIIIDSKSGVTGAGREPKASSHFCEVNEGLHAYGVGTHRHAPEIAQELSLAAGEKVEMFFTPHLVPINRGMLSTIYTRLKPGVAGQDLRQELEKKYGPEPFVQVLPEGTMPHTKWVYGSNQVHIGLYVDEERGMAILVSALDNLARGAAGQAIQNMNLLLGMEETRGLQFPGVHP
ncbi:MAG TPA: N-acetyl-gamma-glutamyl-phosphate reductase [Syntrophomonadaceae bacterium]|nr:N-acetyl-gamma-glutamyl-phosphate reductase [Syntrophomonadaceae bacterium]